MLKETIWMAKFARRGLMRAVHEAVGRAAAWRRFWKAYGKYKALCMPEDLPRLGSLFPCLGDDGGVTPVDPTYFYQDSWAFERILKALPERHVDVGSHHKFVSLLSRAVPVTMIDIRPLPLRLEGLDFMEGSILALPFEDGSVGSLSCLSVVEHIGLGRYGDGLDPRGTEKAVAELARVLAPGGRLYLSLPVAERSGIRYNAHRILSRDYLLQLARPLELVDSRYVRDGKLSDDMSAGECTGLFLFEKPVTFAPGGRI